MSGVKNKMLRDFAVQPVVAPVRAQVLANLREAILTGRLQPGERLVETTLCEVLQVSRTSIREALRQLEAEKLITITPFKGPTVTRMTLKDAEQIYEVRGLLESHAVGLFTVNASPQELKSLEEALQRFEASVNANDALARIQSTDDFYSTILNSWGNEVVREILNGLQGRINYLRYQSMSSPHRATHSLKEMTAIFQAAKERNPTAAAAAAKFHVEQARDAAKKMLEGNNEAED